MISQHPAIQKYMMLQQMAQQQQQGNQQGGGEVPSQEMPEMGMENLQSAPSSSPLESGASAGIQAAKRSLQMNDSENSRALGRAMMHFFSNSDPTGPGFAGALGGINNGFLPALNAYDAERDRIAHENFSLMKHEEDMRRHQQQEELQRMKFMQEMDDNERGYHEMTAYQKAHLDALSGRRTKEERQAELAEHRKLALEEKGLLPHNAVMFGEIEDPNLRKEKQKEIIQRKDKLHSSVKNIKNLEQMQEIFTNYPNLWKDMGRIIEHSLEENPTILKSFFSSFKPGEIAAAQKLRKLSADITVNEIKKFPGRPTDLVKKTIMNTMAGIGSSPDAFNLIKQNMMEDNIRAARDAKKAAEAWQYGYYLPEDTEEQNDFLQNYEHSHGDENFPEMSPEGMGRPIRIRKPDGSIRELPPNFSPEGLQALISRGVEIVE
jgi:hypothetical protein